MLNLRNAVALARLRAANRLQQAAGNRRPPPRSASIIQSQTHFSAQLLEAMRRMKDEPHGPIQAPDALFLAFPERLLSRLAYLAFGPERSRAGSEPGKGTSDTELAVWRKWDAAGSETFFVNFKEKPPRGVLLAHGLSPISDSVLLLADIGRSARAARVLKRDVHVLLADVTWMSYNRSVRRTDLNEDQISHGLRLSLDARTRLYNALGFHSTVHRILPYEQRGAIHEEKLKLIAERYTDLIKLLWGGDLLRDDAPLPAPTLTRLSQDLATSLDPDSPLQTLSRFPHGLRGLESALKPHLEILRTIARRFRTLGIDTFSYYFAQYYAQLHYRGTYVKIAPVSERDFDQPFDELDPYFQSWGEGNVPSVASQTPSTKPRTALTAIYLPQYQLGQWRILPYTPVSLQALYNCGGKSGNIIEQVILLGDCRDEHRDKVARILKQTVEADVVQLNRLIADLTSFLAWVGTSAARDALEEACRTLRVGSVEALLRTMHPTVAEAFAVETEAPDNWRDLWLSWLSATDSVDGPSYVPCHIQLACFEASDWTSERLAAATELVRIANATATRLAS